jgi:hypothetical protein
MSLKAACHALVGRTIASTSRFEMKAHMTTHKVALGFNVLMVVMAIISIMLTVPKGMKAQT